MQRDADRPVCRVVDHKWQVPSSSARGTLDRLTHLAFWVAALSDDFRLTAADVAVTDCSCTHVFIWFPEFHFTALLCQLRSCAWIFVRT